MKAISLLSVLAAIIALGSTTPSRAASGEEGVALAIIYDTSGSMRESVKDESGKQAPKYVIADRALIAITRQLETFATNTVSGAPRKIQAGLYIFGDNGAKEVVKFGPFDGKAMREWAKNFSNPQGNTPLGNALKKAAQTVLESPLTRKHVLVITDGINTAGPAPSAVMPRLKQQAEQKGTLLSVHFVAFDVDAKVFESVKQQGATVVGAADERQLKTQLDYIMQKKILLEEEEPAKKSN